MKVTEAAFHKLGVPSSFQDAGIEFGGGRVLDDPKFLLFLVLII
jgi:hypothetical protein